MDSCMYVYKRTLKFGDNFHEINFSQTKCIIIKYGENHVVNISNRNAFSISDKEHKSFKPQKGISPSASNGSSLTVNVTSA